MKENVTSWLFPDALMESTDGLRTAIRFQGLSISYRELISQIDQAAKFLLDWGLKGGDSVALILRDSPVFVSFFLGAMKIGAVPALISTFVDSDTLEHNLSLCAARLVMAEPDLAPVVLESCHRSEAVKQTIFSNEIKFSGVAFPNLPLRTAETNSDDLAFYLFTSGSTGYPKAVLHTHVNIRHTVENYGRNVLGLTVEDRVFSSSRLFFAYGLGNSLSFPFAARATSILCSERPTPEVISKIFREESPTVFFGVPAIFRALIEYHRRVEPLKTESLRFCVSAGEALPAALFVDWQNNFGLEILDGIGTTEALHMFLSNRRGKARAGSSGTVVNGYAVRILDESAGEVNVGEKGNLFVKGNSFGKFSKSSKDSSAVSFPEWVRTGDVFRCDHEGFYYFCGRSDDHFKVQGLWVVPQEIEETLLAHEAVFEAGVVPMMDEEGLLRPRAHVVLRENRRTTEAELKEFLSLRLHAYQVPHRIVFMEQLPRTATGKLQRYKLRKMGMGQA